MHSVEDRQNAEKAYHDRKYSAEKKVDYYGHGFTSHIFEEMMRAIGDMEDLDVLDYGCGEGCLSKMLARKGARVCSFDISEEVIRTNIERSRGYDHKYPVSFEQMAAEKLNYEDAKFDLIVGVAILHHVELEDSLDEIHRVLKPGGSAWFMEPLGHNALINLYRLATPGLRSEDEKPIRFEQFALIRERFADFRHREYYFLTVAALAWNLLRAPGMMNRTRDVLYGVDRILLKAFPFLRKYCWYSTMTMVR